MMDKTSVPYDTMSTKSVSTESMFSRCCCCIPLRTGCFILGYVSLFINFLRCLFLIGVTLYCGVMTHGFDYMDPSPAYSTNLHSEINHVDGVLKGMNKNSLHLLGWSLVFLTVCDLIWLAINIACVVGIHKKRAGPIRVFIGIGTFRLVLKMIGIMYIISAYNVNISHHIITHFITFGLTAYFILVYYIYAMRLEKEALQKVPEVQQPTIDSYIYPTKLDKEHLVV